jgi:hypothetical protein
MPEAFREYSRAFTFQGVKTPSQLSSGPCPLTARQILNALTDLPPSTPRILLGRQPPGEARHTPSFSQRSIRRPTRLLSILQIDEGHEYCRLSFACQREPGIADTAAKKGPPPWARAAHLL